MYVKIYQWKYYKLKFFSSRDLRHLYEYGPSVLPAVERRPQLQDRLPLLRQQALAAQALAQVPGDGGFPPERPGHQRVGSQLLLGGCGDHRRISHRPGTGPQCVAGRRSLL